ncbi:MAG: hypothetical protein O7G85_08485 [Planctomycetota bacterium]|nr:hypothetical protein [Planctomycetota bacterium]
MYIQSDDFGNLILELSAYLTRSYPSIDFTNAVARVFVWFDAKLRAEPGFISQMRFPTPSAFRAYVRQSIWNDGRRTERDERARPSHQRLDAAREATSRDPEPSSVAMAREQLRRLPLPHLMIVERIVFEDSDPAELAEELALTREEVTSLLEEGLELMIQKRRLRGK